MRSSEKNLDIGKVSLAGVLVTLGIVFGDLGTSPLYVVKAIVGGGEEFNELLIFGSMSCIFWTLTLQTTIKYVFITLRANNNGEGGIYALFALMERKSSWAAVLTMVGSSALLADSVITPAITVTSSIEGLRLFNPEIPVVFIVLLILAVLFLVQQFGTNLVGGSFGIIMVIWFSMLGILGLSEMIHHPEVLTALNPAWAIRFLSEYPGGFILLGSVFLCTTGAEALYSDLGHCGLRNIRVSWAFVKTALLLNYFGQCSWLLSQRNAPGDINPFFGIMPEWFLIPGIIISTAAAVIASQSLITGSYTLMSEAISLNFWPKIKVTYPSHLMGQVYVPSINWFLWIACSFVVVFFRESANMEAAYGLSITLTMIMTTLLLASYLFQKGVNHRLVTLLLLVYLTIEGSFLIANLYKFVNGGWFTILLAASFMLVMYGWYFGRKIKNRYITFANLNKYTDLFRDLVNDTTVPKTATNLVYIVKANRPDQVESKVIYSIFNKHPKRADRYWFLHVNRIDDPNRFDYSVTEIIPGILVKVDFNIGFKVLPRINLYFKEVLEDMEASGEIKLTSSYESLKKHKVPGDFLYILIDRVITRDYQLSSWENFTLLLHTISRLFDTGDVKTLGLDASNTIEEKVPIIIDQPVGRRIKRIDR
ncbi:MAG: KUP/HAK/KT family potassium transporter [Bacteroidales bacterium]|jgi:KUP system potassium uptake protein|nr:KUP/HAK/KT family potassium transporter [Bacteroidales bacterium]